MTTRKIMIAGILLAAALPAFGQDVPAPGSRPSFDQAAQNIQQQLHDSLAELAELRRQIAAQQIPLSRKLSDLEDELVQVRLEYQQTSRLLDSRTLDLTNLRSEIKSRQEQAAYISNLLDEYIRNFESRLHIAEIQRYRRPLDAAKLALENSNLSRQEIYQAQVELLTVSLDRLEDALGGTRFEGTAVDPSGHVETGTFVLIGPAALFRSADGTDIGIVEQRLGSLEPSLVEFRVPEDTLAADALVTSAVGLFPLDPTLGNAHKIEATRESLLAHIQKGGPVMVPIFALAGAALLVALCKWLRISLVRIPSEQRTAALLDAVARRDPKAVLEKAEALKKFDPQFIRDWLIGGLFGAGALALTGLILGRFHPNLPSDLKAFLDTRNSLWIVAGIGAVLGSISKYLINRFFSFSPVGAMLAVGAEHLNQPRELIEEVMYEKVLSTRLKLQRFLPFIAISAASAPLLGLLGTVTGIINTFKLITVFGSGDVKTLSGGISEALITTEFGLIVAIPSLLIHAFLSRKVNSVINQMEKAAVTFVNQVSKSAPQSGAEPISDKALVPQAPPRTPSTGRLKPAGGPIPIREFSKDRAGGRMKPQTIHIPKTATVADAIRKIRDAGIENDMDAVFIVDEQGKYAGYVPIGHLLGLRRSAQTRMEFLADKKPVFVRVDTHMNDVHSLFKQYNLLSLPVLDHHDQLVGRVTRSGNGDGL